MPKISNLSVTIISHSFPSVHFPVAGVFVKDQAEALSKFADVEVIAPKPKTNYLLRIIKKKWKYYSEIPKYETLEDYNLIRPSYRTYPKKYFYRSIGENIWNAIKTELKEKTDIFHVHFAYPTGSTIAKIKDKFPDKTVVLSIHGNDWYLSKNDRYLRNIIYKNFLKADKILPVSNSLGEDIINNFPELENKITVLYNGINENITDYPKSDSTFTSKNRIKILMVGAFVEGKGVRILLQALDQINLKEIEVVIIGNIIDPKNYKDLLKLRKHLNLTEKVKFLISLPREKVYQHLRDCDYFILPSLKEGFGIAIIEALMFGKPVISTYSGGPQEIITEHNGMLIAPGDVDALKNAIIKMNSTYMDYSSEKLSKDTINKFGMKNTMQKLLHIYKESK